jgi:sodium-dependent dicarboxylate transporter 2/3/5
MSHGRGTSSWVWLLAGPALAALVWWMLPVEQKDEAGKVVSGLSDAGRAACAVGVLMAVWWVTEAVPLEATSLLPLVLMPALGISSVQAAAAPYGDPTIFFFMGGMMLGAAMERWGVPRRVALIVLSRFAFGPRLLVLGAMTAAALVSMWVNNTSTTVMMLPIGMSLVRLIEREKVRPQSPQDRAHEGIDNFGFCMVLGIAYAATIGGVGTLFGTAPNLVLQSTVEHVTGERLTFAQFSMVGIPLVLLYIPMCWGVLVWMFPFRFETGPAVKEHVRQELRELGSWTWPERAVVGVLVVAGLLWVFTDGVNGWVRSRSGIDRAVSEAGVAVAAALALFMMPAMDGRGSRVLDWPTASTIQWGVLVLFGGGLSLAQALSTTGVNTAIGSLFGMLDGLPLFLIILTVAAIVTFATEVASNTAIATTFLPIAAAGAGGLGVDPLVLMIPVAMAASLAFMMPMGTPPNALAFATGRVPIRSMVRVGLVLNIVSIVLLTCFLTLVGPALVASFR